MISDVYVFWRELLFCLICCTQSTENTLIHCKHSEAETNIKSPLILPHNHKEVKHYNYPQFCRNHSKDVTWFSKLSWVHGLGMTMSWGKAIRHMASQLAAAWRAECSLFVAAWTKWWRDSSGHSTCWVERTEPLHKQEHLPMDAHSWASLLFSSVKHSYRVCNVSDKNFPHPPKACWPHPHTAYWPHPLTSVLASTIAVDESTHTSIFSSFRSADQRTLCAPNISRISFINLHTHKWGWLLLVEQNSWKL